MFTAALRSRWCEAPQAPHLHCLSFKDNVALMVPQSEQVLLLG